MRKYNLVKPIVAIATMAVSLVSSSVMIPSKQTSVVASPATDYLGTGTIGEPEFSDQGREIQPIFDTLDLYHN